MDRTTLRPFDAATHAYKAEAYVDDAASSCAGIVIRDTKLPCP